MRFVQNAKRSVSRDSRLCRCVVPVLVDAREHESRQLLHSLVGSEPESRSQIQSRAVLT